MITAKFICQCSLCGDKKDYSYFDGKHWSTGIDLKQWHREHLRDWHPLEAKQLEEQEAEDDGDTYFHYSSAYYFIYRMVTPEEGEIDSSRRYQFYEDGTCSSAIASEPYVVERGLSQNKPNEYTTAFRSAMYESPKLPDS